MNRWLFLLALPYVVTVQDALPIGKQYYLKGFEVCASTGDACDYLYDVAAILNQAHEERLNREAVEENDQRIKDGNEYLQAIADKENGIDKEIAK